MPKYLDKQRKNAEREKMPESVKTYKTEDY